MMNRYYHDEQQSLHYDVFGILIEEEPPDTPPVAPMPLDCVFVSECEPNSGVGVVVKPLNDCEGRCIVLFVACDENNEVPVLPMPPCTFPAAVVKGTPTPIARGTIGSVRAVPEGVEEGGVGRMGGVAVSVVRKCTLICVFK